jgi:hypothetical protein
LLTSFFRSVCFQRTRCAVRRENSAKYSHTTKPERHLCCGGASISSRPSRLSKFSTGKIEIVSSCIFFCSTRPRDNGFVFWCEHRSLQRTSFRGSTSQPFVQEKVQCKCAECESVQKSVLIAPSQMSHGAQVTLTIVHSVFFFVRAGRDNRLKAQLQEWW